MGVPLFTIKGSTLFSIKGFAVVGLLTKKMGSPLQAQTIY